MNNKPINPQAYAVIYEAFDTISQSLDTLHSNDVELESRTDQLIQMQLSLHTTLNALITLLYNNGIIDLEDLEERKKFINLLNNNGNKKEETK